MVAPSLTRRRFLHITALSGAAAALPLSALGARGRLSRWRGIALGAEASMQIALPKPSQAEILVQHCLQEITRCERLFSLYDPQSSLSQLNRQGYLTAPPAELVALLEQAGHVSALSGGAFDVTVQPLWALYAAHFAAHPDDEKGPPEAAVEQARELVDYRKLHVTPERIVFERPGMQVTLNGIAQGYITDRVTALLKRHGITRTLVEMGEMRALGGHPDERPWQVGIRHPHEAGALAATLPLQDRALATSGGYGTRFDTRGRHHHLLQPHEGKSALHHASVSVLAPEAALADALSTALYVMQPQAARRLAASLPGVGALFILPDGTQHKAGALV